MKNDYEKVKTQALLIEHSFTNTEKLLLCTLLLDGMKKEKEASMKYKND